MTPWTEFTARPKKMRIKAPKDTYPIQINCIDARPNQRMQRLNSQFVGKVHALNAGLLHHTQAAIPKLSNTETSVGNHPTTERPPITHPSLHRHNLCEQSTPFCFKSCHNIPAILLMTGS